MVRRSCVLVLGLAGCGPLELEPADLDPICDDASPVKILDLDPDRPLARLYGPRPVADRHILDVGYWDLAGGAQPPLAGDTELWSVGTCGEDPLLLAENMEVLQAVNGVWPDAVAVCAPDTGQVLMVDPTGAREPNAVFQAAECWAVEAAGGLLTHEPNGNGTTALIHQPFPVDPWDAPAEAHVLLEAVQTRYDRPQVYWYDDHLVTLDWEDQLVRVSLPDGAIEVLATEVRDFTSNETHVLWQGTENTGGTKDHTEGPVYLLDRATGESTYLVDTALSYTGFLALSMTELGFVRLNLQADYSPTWIFALPALDHIELDDIGMLWPATEHAILAYHDGDLSLVNTEDWTPERLLPGVQYSITTTADSTEILQRDDKPQASGKLYRLRGDEDLEVMSPKATSPYHILPDDRVVTPIRLDGGWIGTLVVNRPGDITQRVIDDEVVGYSIRPREETGVILYAVEDGDRTGVWLAQLAEP